MIILDTNVVSELMAPIPDPKVLAWALACDPADLFSTAITTYEIEFGIARLDPGARKDRLVKSWSVVATRYLASRSLPLDEAAASRASLLRSAAMKRGHNCDICDLFIAGIADCRGATVATRNLRHFSDLGVMVVNPWQT